MFVGPLAMAAPALFRENPADKGKGEGDGFSKTKMLITLKTEVVNVRAQLQEEQAKREQLQDWLRDTLKPMLVDMKKEYTDALREMNGSSLFSRCASCRRGRRDLDVMRHVHICD